jgi:site-specific recombinase XerD
VPEWLALKRAAQHDLRAHALLLCLYEFGMRREEPGLMRLSYLEKLHEGRIYIYRQKESLSGWVDGVSQGARQALMAWVQYAYPLKDERTRDNFVFPGGRRRDGASQRGITGRTVYNVYRMHAQHAGLEQDLQHPHILKASRAQHLLEHMTTKGLDPWLALKTVAKILGHATAQTTIKHYIAQTTAEKADLDAFTDEMTGD